VLWDEIVAGVRDYFKHVLKRLVPRPVHTSFPPLRLLDLHELRKLGITQQLTNKICLLY
jgi:hypothetical protein